MYPIHRPRRLRKNPAVRALVRETSVPLTSLIYPFFVAEGFSTEKPIEAMPGVSQHSIDSALKETTKLFEKGVKSFIVFGLPAKKDERATSAYDEKGIVQQMVRKMRKEMPDAVLFTDVCLCQFTDHGHCGVLRDGIILNDESVDLLAKTALSHAAAGADFVAPSDMMDGRVAGIRKTLDSYGHEDVGILSYAAKFSSAFYGPFREAAHSSPKFGDRKTHQMDPANRREALKEMRMDLEEGADMLMVKPALSYLDIISDARENFEVPIAAYNVSGEYSMVKAGAQKGWIDERLVRDEILLSIRRAGADLIITYFAKDIALE